MSSPPKHAGVGIITFTDSKNISHVLLAYNDPRWRLDEKSKWQFVGGHIDPEDQQLTRVKALSSEKLQGMSDDQKTWLEGTLRETQEESGVAVSTWLQPDGFVVATGTDQTSTTHVHFFHIHLGNLSEEKIAALKQAVQPTDDVLCAGFFPYTAFQKEGADYVAKEPWNYVKQREWLTVPLTEAEKNSEDGERWCALNALGPDHPGIHLDYEAIYADEVALSRRGTAFSNGLLAKQAFDRIAHPQSRVAELQPPPSLKSARHTRP